MTSKIIINHLVILLIATNLKQSIYIRYYCIYNWLMHTPELFVQNNPQNACIWGLCFVYLSRY